MSSREVHRKPCKPFGVKVSAGCCPSGAFPNAASQIVNEWSREPGTGDVVQPCTALLQERSPEHSGGDCSNLALDFGASLGLSQSLRWVPGS